jgi:probable rRNA maturation factor
VLALSLPTLAREAFLYGQDPAEHMLRLLSHGLLHLAGFDHGPAMDAASQEAMDLAEAFLAARP